MGFARSGGRRRRSATMTAPWLPKVPVEEKVENRLVLYKDPNTYWGRSVCVCVCVCVSCVFWEVEVRSWYGEMVRTGAWPPEKKNIFLLPVLECCIAECGGDLRQYGGDIETGLGEHVREQGWMTEFANHAVIWASIDVQDMSGYPKLPPLKQGDCNYYVFKGSARGQDRMVAMGS